MIILVPFQSPHRHPCPEVTSWPFRHGGLYVLVAMLALGTVACSRESALSPDAAIDTRPGHDARQEQIPPSDLALDGDGNHVADTGLDGPATTKAPQISPVSGAYPYGTMITLSAEPQAAIYYTLNGGPPTPSSTLYSNPFRLTGQVQTLTVQAMAVTPGKRSSAVSTVQYTRHPGIIVHFKKPASWTTAYIHYWSTVPGNLETTWPGTPMTPEEDGWYSFTLQGQSAIHMVFNNQGPPQSEDLYLDLPEGWYQLGDVWNINPDHFTRFAFPQGTLKALVMSFDDGNLQDKQLITLFNAHGIRGTFHLNSGLMGQSDKVPASEVKTVYAGHEVSVHSATHPFLDTMDQAQLTQEIFEDKKALEALVGYPMGGLSYPFGSYNTLLLSLLPGWGLVYGRVVPSTADFRLPNNLLLWRGTCHHSEALSFANQLLAYQQPEMALLFVWGHSWELDQGTAQNSWQYMEDLCQLLGQHSDIWYATAIEVADYLTALRAVEFSLTDDTVHNPNPVSVWLNKSGQTTELKPQATQVW